MPRPNQPRSIASETALSRRVAHERERLGWSYDGLASRMTQVGCAIQSSAIYKIEKTGRRITVDELVGFSEVFGIPVAQMLLPPELAMKRELADRVIAWDSARLAWIEASERHDLAWQELVDLAQADPTLGEAFEWALGEWVRFYFDDAKDHEGALAYRMWKLTNAESWADRVRTSLNEHES